jgi:hypothetical protein
MQRNKSKVIIMAGGEVLVAPHHPSRSTTVPSATTSDKLYRVGRTLGYPIFTRQVCKEKPHV